MGNIINAVVSGLFIGPFFIYAGSKLLQVRFKKTFRSFSISFLVMVFSVLSYIYMDNGAKMTIVYLIVLFAYKIMFNKNTSQSAVAALISYLLLTVGELLFMVGIAIANKISFINNMEVFKGNIFVNASIAILAVLLLHLLLKPLNKVVVRTKENNKFTLIFTCAILLIALCSLFYKIYFSKFRLDETLVLNVMLIISITYIGVVILKQRYDKARISEEYEVYVEYSKQSEKLVEEYSISQHENKNELIIIKSMVHKSNKKLLEYLDEIIISKDNIKSAWIRHLRYIPFGGLKGILHNKISVMKDAGINVFLDISKEIGKSNLKKLTMKENNQLSKVIGVFLDNAKEAAILSDAKEVSISIFMNTDDVVFEIYNSYQEKEIDIKSLYDSGHSTKGKGRGYGLSLVKTIVDENPMFINETKIVDEYFVQILKVILKNKNGN
ncbi:MAG: GHKL domain-containing protein [Bacilli bacterium]|nr:GHKL domain-containing protein [Bacilli bacterium]